MRTAFLWTAVAVALMPLDGVGGQVIDSSGGAVQMVPGGAVGKGDTAAIESHDAAAGDKSEYVPTSEDEQLSRRLIVLKDQRAALAERLGAGDAQVKDLDSQLTALRQSIAQRSLAASDQANAGNLSGGEDGGQGMPTYPRIVGPAYDGFTDEQAKDTGPAAESTGDATTRKALENASVTCRADAQPLQAVLGLLGNEVNAPIDINWKELATAGIERTTPVSVNLMGVPGGKALRLILAQAGGANASLGYTIDGGEVCISTRDDLNSAKYQLVRVYDVRDLLNRQGNALPTQYDVQMYGGRVETLIDTIRTTVAPDTWRDSGGVVGTIRELDGQLIINQTADNHRDIQNLLTELRSR